MKTITRLLAVLVFTGFASSVSAGPITGGDIVTVDGTDWAQVDIFSGLGWADINAVCSGGVCGNGTLNGHDMLGWQWASIEDMNDLFNYYIGSPELGPGPDGFGPIPDVFGAGFFADGWRATQHEILDSSETVGAVFDHMVFTPMIGVLPSIGLSIAYTNLAGNIPSADGGWFYKADVPAPATIPLLVIAFAALRLNRRRK